MRLGTNVTSITPHVPVLLGGYGARTEPARGVHDPLTARALVLEDGPLRVGLVVADVVMLFRPQVDAVRARASTLTGIDARHIIVAATHTHSGPITVDSPHFGGQADPAYAAWLVEAMAGSLYQASLQMEEVRTGWGTGFTEGVGSSRRATSPKVGAAQVGDSAGDDRVGEDRQPLAALSFVRPDESLRAALVNFQCHPTVMGPDNLEISADLAGAGRTALQKLLGPGVFLAFVNGSCGDVSTRFTRRSQTFGELSRLGGLLGAAAASVVLRTTWREPPDGMLRAGQMEVPLPARQLPSREEAARQLVKMQRGWEEAQANPGLTPGQRRLARTALEGAQVQAFLVENQNSFERTAVLDGWRLGAFGLTTIPGELFSSLGDYIRRHSGLAATLVVGYSGGHVGYIPDREAFAQGGYEVLSSPLAPEAAEVLAEAAVRLLRDLE